MCVLFHRAAAPKRQHRELTVVLPTIAASSEHMAVLACWRLPSSIVRRLARAFESAKAARSSVSITSALNEQMLEFIEDCRAGTARTSKACLAATSAAGGALPEADGGRGRTDVTDSGPGDAARTAEEVEEDE